MGAEARPGCAAVRTLVGIVATQHSERKPAETVRPFLNFRDVPDQEKFLDGLRDRHGSRNQNQTRTVATFDELAKVPRHGPDIVCNQNPAQRRSNSENFRVRHAFGDHSLRQLEIKCRFSAKNTCDDILVEIGICEKTEKQPYLGKASSRGRFNFLDRLSGSGICLAANS